MKIEKFVEIWNFRHFSTVCLYLDREVRGFLYFLVEISQSVETLGLDNVEISRQISKILTRLNKSRQSRRVSTNLTKISTRQSLDWKISILKISTEKKKVWSWPSRKSWQFKKVSLDTKDVLDLDLDWSRLSRPPGLILWAGRTNDSFYGQVGQKTHFMYRSDKWRILFIGRTNGRSDKRRILCIGRTNDTFFI